MNLTKELTVNVVLRKLLIVLSCIFLAWTSALANDKPAKITGTYSDFKLNAESGDLVGHELRILLAGKEYKGVLQFADGEPSDIILVPLKISGKKISFTIPKGLPDSGKFDGVFEISGIKGVFSYSNGASEKVNLKRGISYWDR